jgi:peptide/nickel transport system substrate-binding protein
MDATYFLNFTAPKPEHVWGQYTAAELLEAEVSSRSPLGWGPYIIEEWATGEYISLTKNPNYFRADEGLPKFDNLVYRIVGENSNANIAAILSGECDIVDQTSHLDDQSELLLELQAAGELVATFVTGTVWEHIDFNIAPLEGSSDFALSGALADVRVRKAFLHCMDRQAVVDTVMFGQSIVLDTYIPPEHPLFNTEVMHYDFDIEAGIALLEEAGWMDEDGDGVREKDGQLLETALETTSATQRQQATQILADSMAQCGIKVNLNYYPASEWFADGPDGKLFGRRFDLGQFAWLTGVEPSCGLYLTENIPGPEDELNEDGTAKYPYGWGGQNETGWSNAEYDAVCNAAQQSLPGTPEYEENHLEAQRLFGENLPVAPLYLRLKLAAHRPDLCNFVMDPTNNSEMWNIEEFDYGAGCDM